MGRPCRTSQDVITAYITFWNEYCRGDLDIDRRMIFMWILEKQDENLWTELSLVSVGAFVNVVVKFCFDKIEKYLTT
jgi:hypothetical protein